MLSNWNYIKDSKPDREDYYLVYIDQECDDCDNNKSHNHRLNFRNHVYEVALWVKGDPKAIEKYGLEIGREFKHDHWAETSWYDEDIKYWMELPTRPVRKSND